MYIICPVDGFSEFLARRDRIWEEGFSALMLDRKAIRAAARNGLIMISFAPRKADLGERADCSCLLRARREKSDIVLVNGAAVVLMKS